MNEEYGYWRRAGSLSSTGNNCLEACIYKIFYKQVFLIITYDDDNNMKHPLPLSLTNHGTFVTNWPRFLPLELVTC